MAVSVLSEMVCNLVDVSKYLSIKNTDHFNSLKITLKSAFATKLSQILSPLKLWVLKKKWQL